MCIRSSRYEMKTIEEVEPDDEGSVYFLKPVNEYNIEDKIKEANKELFVEMTDGNLQTSSKTSLSMSKTSSATNRKVSFALNLEQYAPQPDNENMKYQLDEVNTSEDIDDNNIYDNIIDKLTTLEEEFQFKVEQQLLETLTLKQIDNMLLQYNEIERAFLEYEKPDCQQSIFQNNEKQQITDQEDNVNDSDTFVTKKIFKQNIYDDENEYDDYSDKANVQIIEQYINDQKNTNKNNKNTNIIQTIIEPEINNKDEALEKLYTNKEDIVSVKQTSYLIESFKSKTRNSPSLQQKSKKSLKNDNTSNSPEASKSKLDIHGMKLHYKECCKYKLEQQKLPKYNGFLSEYGLSREQLVEYNVKQQKRQHSILQRTLKISEQEMLRMNSNERAFTKWLHNKMLYPINKTRNMFDIKRSFVKNQHINNINNKRQNSRC